MSEGQTVRYEVAGRVATVTLDRPRYRNAQSWLLLDELDGAPARARRSGTRGARARGVALETAVAGEPCRRYSRGPGASGAI